MALQTERTGAGWSVSWRTDHVKLRDVAWCCDKLATMQGAGLPLYQAVSTLARMKKGTPLGRRLEDIAERIGEGQSFATAFRAHEDVFEPLTCALVETGEATGNIQPALARAAELIEVRLRLRRKVRSAMTYPTVVAVMTTALISALLVFIVPRFEEIYREAGGELPLMTQVLVSVSKWLPPVLGTLALGAAAVVVASRLASTREATRSTLARLRMATPVIGPLLRRAAEARVAATLANLLSAGVPLLDALDLTARSTSESRLSDALVATRRAIDEGSAFAPALESTGAFPEMMVSLAEVGETSGALAELMERYASSAEEEVIATAESLASVVEPLMMVTVGVVVGVFLIALYLPLISIGDQIR